MTRVGLFRYVAYGSLPAMMARGWMPLSDLGQSILCWHCDCGQVEP